MKTEKLDLTLFLKITAVCSIFGALTTALLMWLPNPTAEGFETSAELYQNDLFMAKKWILFIHPQVNLIAALGMAVLLFRRHPVLVLLGTLFLMVWGYTEMVQQAFLIDAQNQIWRPGYLNATDEQSKEAFFYLLKGVPGFSDSQYFVILYGFGLGTLLFGLAMVRETNWGRWIGIALLLIGAVSIAAFMSYYLGADFFGPITSWFYSWIYPTLQPLVRVAIGVWIFMEIIKRRQESSVVDQN